jgi:hypothetical protein
MSRQCTHPTRVNIFMSVKHFFTKGYRANNRALNDSLRFDFL